MLEVPKDQNISQVHVEGNRNYDLTRDLFGLGIQHSQTHGQD